MQTRHMFTRTTLAAALLSAFLLAQPAHAGLLGGGTSGGFGGGLTGTVGHRSLDVGGSAAGRASPDVRLPRADRKAAETANAAAAKGTEVKDSATSQGRAAGEAAAKTASDQAAGAQGTRANVNKNASVAAQPESIEAGAAGAAQVSHGDRSVTAGGSAQGSVRQ